MQTGIREKALAAAQERRETSAAMEQAREAARGRELSQKLHDILGLDVKCETGSVDIDGVPFSLHDDYDGNLLAIIKDDKRCFVHNWCDVGDAIAAMEADLPPATRQPIVSKFEKHLAESCNNACTAENYGGGEQVTSAELALICSNLSVAAAMRALAVEMHTYHDFVAYSQ